VQVGVVVAALFMASLGAEFFLVTLYLQDVRGYDPVSAGLAFLPLVLALILGTAAARRFRVLAMAFFCGAAGLLVLAIAAATGAGLWTGVLPGLVIAGFGQGAAFTGLFAASTAGLPAHRRELGAGLLTTVQHAGGSIGIAVYVLLIGHADGFATAFTLAAALSAGAGLLVLAYLPRRADVMVE
jgi:hypothetical protein